MTRACTEARNQRVQTLADWAIELSRVMNDRGDADELRARAETGEWSVAQLLARLHDHGKTGAPVPERGTGQGGQPEHSRVAEIIATRDEEIADAVLQALEDLADACQGWL